jgi:hypothetical protein
MKKLIHMVLALIVAQLAGVALAQQNTTAAQSTASQQVITEQQTPAVPQNPEAPAAPASAPTSAPSSVSDAPVLSLLVSPYTYHFNPKPTHKPVHMVGVLREHANDKIDGVVFFTNSFGQPSVYLYPWGGVYKSIGGINHLSFKWTAGFIYGYKDEFKDEVANVGGIAPVIIWGFAYEFKPGWSAQINVLGKAAAQLQFNMPLKF